MAFVRGSSIGGKKLKMLASTGAQIVPLPYRTSDGVKLKFKMLLGYPSSEGVIFGDDWSQYGVLFYFTNNRKFGLRVVSWVSDNIPIKAFEIVDVEFDYTTGILKLNNDTYGEYHAGNNYTINLFGISTSHRAWVALSDISIEQNGSEIMHLEPRLNSQTGGGYYHDTIGDQDYYSTTGTDLIYTEI